MITFPTCQFRQNRKKKRECTLGISEGSGSEGREGNGDENIDIFLTQEGGREGGGRAVGGRELVGDVVCVGRTLKGPLSAVSKPIYADLCS